MCSLLGATKIEGHELQPDFGFSGGLIIVYPDYSAPCLVARIFTEELSCECWNIYFNTCSSILHTFSLSSFFYCQELPLPGWGTNELRTYNRITTVTDFGVDLRLIAMTATGVQNSKSPPSSVAVQLHPATGGCPISNQCWVVVNKSEVQFAVQSG